MAKIVDFKKLYSQKRLVYAVLLSCEHIVAVPPSPHLSLTTGEEMACPFCPPEGIHCPPKADHECVHCGQPAVRCWTIPAGPRYCTNVWLCRFCDTPAGQLLAQYPDQVDAGTVLAHVSAVAHKLAEELKR